MKIPFILKRLPEIESYFKSLSRSYHYQSYIAFNVKMHDALFIDRRDLPDILKDNCTPEIKDFLCANVTDEEIRKQWDYWIDDQREYFKEWVDGCAFSSPKYWDAEIKRLKETGETSYYQLGADRVKADVPTLEKYRAESKRALNYLNHFDSSDVYFLGSSGGWLCLEKFCKVEEMIWKCYNCCEELEDAEAYDEFIDIYKYYKAVQFIETHVKEVVEGSEADFKYILGSKFCQDEFLEELGFVSEDERIEKRLQAIAV